MFWIPFIPLFKKVFFECSHGKRSLAPKEGPRALQTLAQTARTSARTLFYLFTGLAAFVLLLAVGAVLSRANAQNEQAWVAAPARGDFYVLNAATVLPGHDGEDTDYIVGRVDTVTRDTGRLTPFRSRAHSSRPGSGAAASWRSCANRQAGLDQAERGV